MQQVLARVVSGAARSSLRVHDLNSLGSWGHVPRTYDNVLYRMYVCWELERDVRSFYRDVPGVILTLSRTCRALFGVSKGAMELSLIHRQVGIPTDRPSRKRMSAMWPASFRSAPNRSRGVISNAFQLPSSS